MRAAYLIAALIVAMLTIFNVPRLAFIEANDGGMIGLLRGFNHGIIGFSYVGAWTLIVGGVYQLILGIVYWDAENIENERWAFTLDTGGTAKLLWLTGGIALLLGVGWAWYVYTNDLSIVEGKWGASLASTLAALLACWLAWLAFPLLEQVGIDRENMGV